MVVVFLGRPRPCLGLGKSTNFCSKTQHFVLDRGLSTPDVDNSFKNYYALKNPFVILLGSSFCLKNRQKLDFSGLVPGLGKMGCGSVILEAAGHEFGAIEKHQKRRAASIGALLNNNGHPVGDQQLRRLNLGGWDAREPLA